MTRADLDAALARLAASPSLVSAGRACVGYSAGGLGPELPWQSGFGRSWIGSAVPWWLFPLRWFGAADRTLVEIFAGEGLLTFAAEADPCFILQFQSFSSGRLDEVFSYVRAHGGPSSPGDVLERDPSLFEIDIACDGARHETWHVRTRHGPECPSDLIASVEALEPRSSS